MTEPLPAKLQKRLDKLKAAGGIALWHDAVKQYRQLEERGLVVRGESEGVSYAVDKDKVPQEE